MKFSFSSRAEKEFLHLQSYIQAAGYPETAQKYGERMKSFIEGLNNNPHSYARCRHESFRKYGYHCAVFEGTYIIVYKIFKTSIRINRVIHGKLIR